MHPTRLALAIFALCGCAADPPSGTGQDYRPVVCTEAAPYEGPSPHPPVRLPQTHPLSVQGLDRRTAQALDEAFRTALASTGAPGMSTAVAVPGRGSWARAAGTGTDPLLYWASAGKSLIATAVLMLVQEGRLSLEDPVSRWIEGVPNGGVATIRHLLSHTAGLFSANEDRQAQANPGPRSLQEELRILARHGALACPGARWRYSNSGYVLLGAIIERVEGWPWQDVVEARIIRPLGLTRMLVLRAGEADVAPLVSSRGQPIAPEWPGAAGPVAASAGDMLRFWAALLEGRLLPLPVVATMFDPLFPMFDQGTFYGLGAMAFEVPGRDGTTTLWLGHAGGTPGASAVVAYVPALDAFVAAALTGDGSAAAVANLLLRQLRNPGRSGAPPRG